MFANTFDKVDVELSIKAITSNTAANQIEGDLSASILK